MWREPLLCAIIYCMTRHPSVRSGDTVHHVYPNGPAEDLIPFCGIIPGPDEDGVWHTGHAFDELLELSSQRKACCVPCLLHESEMAKSEDDTEDDEDEE